jgi:large subunit ribosomal protein L40
MSTTSALAKGPAKGAQAKSSKPSKTPKQGGRKKNQVVRSDAYERVKILKQNMFSAAPPPLRMARLRWLRHWTIHRAWQLFRRQQREATLKERYRMHAGMYNACEELRKTVGPGNRSEGYLYRVAMEKKGVWGTNAIPIEYARLQTDFPAKQAWNHDWKR